MSEGGREGVGECANKYRYANLSINYIMAEIKASSPYNQYYDVKDQQYAHQYQEVPHFEWL